MQVSVFKKIIGLARKTPFHPQWLLNGQHQMSDELRALPPGVVLDIGCADRWVERQLPPRCEYIGLDYLATGKYMYRSQPDIFADASSLPLADNSVDTVVLLAVAEHLRYPQAALSEISRVLRSNGKLLLTMPFLYPVHDAPNDYQRYTIYGLRREISEAGLVPESLSPSVGSSETAGLIACLALGGMALQSVRDRHLGVVLLPILLLLIPVINVGAWTIGRLLPNWPALTACYDLVARKP